MRTLRRRPPLFGSVSDAEAGQGFGARGLVGAIQGADLAGEGLLDGGEEAVDLGGVTLRDQFDSAVGEVADVAFDVVITGQALGCVAEANTLNAAVGTGNDVSGGTFRIARRRTNGA